MAGDRTLSVSAAVCRSGLPAWADSIHAADISASGVGTRPALRQRRTGFVLAGEACLRGSAPPSLAAWRLAPSLGSANDASAAVLARLPALEPHFGYHFEIWGISERALGAGSGCASGSCGTALFAQHSMRAQDARCRRGRKTGLRDAGSESRTSGDLGLAPRGGRLSCRTKRDSGKHGVRKGVSRLGLPAQLENMLSIRCRPTGAGLSVIAKRV